MQLKGCPIFCKNPARKWPGHETPWSRPPDSRMGATGTQGESVQIWAGVESPGGAYKAALPALSGGVTMTTRVKMILHQNPEPLHLARVELKRIPPHQCLTGFGLAPRHCHLLVQEWRCIAGCMLMILHSMLLDDLSKHSHVDNYYRWLKGEVRHPTVQGPKIQPLTSH